MCLLATLGKQMENWKKNSLSLQFWYFRRNILADLMMLVSDMFISVLGAVFFFKITQQFCGKITEDVNSSFFFSRLTLGCCISATTECYPFITYLFQKQQNAEAKTLNYTAASWCLFCNFSDVFWLEKQPQKVISMHKSVNISMKNLCSPIAISKPKNVHCWATNLSGMFYLLTPLFMYCYLSKQMTQSNDWFRNAKCHYFLLE